jgi:hypothetical protein
LAGRSSPGGRRRPGAARPSTGRAVGTTAAPANGPSLDEATRPRLWQDLELRVLDDPSQARPLFDFAAVPSPAGANVAFGWGAFPMAGAAPVAVVLVERAGRAVFLHGPLVAIEGHGYDPLTVAAQLLAAVTDHAAALGADTLFARPQGLDRMWIRCGFIPVPEAALPAAIAGRPGAGLYGWRGGSALWTLRDAGDAAA